MFQSTFGEIRIVRLLKYLWNFLKAKPAGKVLSPEDCARLACRATTRPCDLGDFPELSSSQKVVVLLRALGDENLHLFYQELAPENLHLLSRQQQLLPSATPALQSLVLREYLGIQQSETGDLPRLLKCLNTYAQGERKNLANELTALLVGDWEAKQMSQGESYLLFYQDFRHDQKAALLFRMTNILNEPRLQDWLPHDCYAYVLGVQPILVNLRLVTKLRVLREFLDIPIEQAPAPDFSAEFARLTLALQSICESDPERFVGKVRERWPEMGLNPLILKMFERR